MTPAESLLTTLRRTTPIPPATFVSANPGCWLQYFDDTPARDSSKALAARQFDPEMVRRKQEDHCAVCFSLQAFGDSRTKEGLLCFRNLGVDVDLVPSSERGQLSVDEIDQRKCEYLAECLLQFPLRPHWLIETRHGFHVIFRVKPVRESGAVREAETINRRLVRALRGDENAALLTQVLRVPGTFQFKNPTRPFLCRLLVNNASTFAPYDLDDVRRILDTPGPFHSPTMPRLAARHPDGGQRSNVLGGVPEGRRNAAAAAIVGGIIGRLPEAYWDVAGWGGLKEWNLRNSVPLPEYELRAVFASIARLETRKRQRHQDNESRPADGNPTPAA